MSVQKAKGTRAETWLERECLAWGLTAKRIDMGRGIGDLELWPHGHVDHPRIIVQVKDNKDYNRTKPPTTWLDQAQKQAAKAGAALGILVVKPAGVGYRRVPDWHAWLTLADLTTLLKTLFGTLPEAAGTFKVYSPGLKPPVEPWWDHPVRVSFGSILILLGGTAPT